MLAMSGNIQQQELMNKCADLKLIIKLDVRAVIS